MSAPAAGPRRSSAGLRGRQATGTPPGGLTHLEWLLATGLALLVVVFVTLLLSVGLAALRVIFG